MQTLVRKNLQIVKLSNNAYLPTKETPMSAGYDLYSAYDYIIPANGKNIIKTDLQICVPFGTYGRIAPCSSLAWFNHIDVGAGVIDFDYCGNVFVVLFNHSNTDFTIKAGNKIAQLICEKIVNPNLEEITIPTLSNTERNKKGFGFIDMD